MTLAPQRRVVAVAYSGGRDSTALLHATAVAARDAGVEVLALHVHHGLSAHADAWLARGEAVCRRWCKRGLPVSFAFERLSTRPTRGESIEAWARRERYRALRRLALANGATVVLLAQHRRDQAETFVLQALRGAGVAGLAGMPHEVERDGITWIRPWLDRPREAIEAYARRFRLAFVDDDGNDDPRHARNRLRLEVWPALTDAFENVEASLADAAAWAQQARDNLADLGRIDLAAVASEQGLHIPAWRELVEHRRANALREWLRREIGRAPSAALCTRLMEELPSSPDGRWSLDAAELRAHRGVARVVATPAIADVNREPHASIRRAGRHALPGWGGVLVVRRVRQGGVPLAWLGQIELRERRGGEQFQAGLGRPPRSLKKQYQAAGVPAWMRDGPLVYSGGQLVFVPGLGLDARVIALPGQAQALLSWERAPTGAPKGAG